MIPMGTTPLVCAEGLGVEAEGGVAVGGEDEGVGLDAGAVADDADDEVEEGARVLGGDDDHDPAEDDGDEGQDPEDDQDDVMGDGQEPLDEGEPAVEVGFGVGVLDVEVDGLVFVGGGVLVAQGQDVDLDAVDEAAEFEVPVEPPARVLVAEDQHQDEGKPEEWDGDGRLVGAAGLAAVDEAGNERGDDEDGDDHDETEEGGEAVEGAVGVVDGELDGVVGLVAGHGLGIPVAAGGHNPMLRARSLANGRVVWRAGLWAVSHHALAARRRTVRRRGDTE